jgi:hypothetical protein
MQSCDVKAQPTSFVFIDVAELPAGAIEHQLSSRWHPYAVIVVADRC